MAQAVGSFSGANQPENELFTLDFVNDLPGGDSIRTCSVASGTDAHPADRLVGSPTVFGTRVTQRASGFLPGVQYVMACVVMTAMGSELELWAFLPGEAVGC